MMGLFIGEELIHIISRMHKIEEISFQAGGMSDELDECAENDSQFSNFKNTRTSYATTSTTKACYFRALLAA